ncbi:MAG: hypothetical protein EBS87_07970 [Sphingomonadaceae bacterium]|jgi:hypothetical protein|nr:hypothetical protein [Sphingomonadaceae bacterium]NCA02109.1 hypothetical protein [Sphingomonadaceae bacterium]
MPSKKSQIARIGIDAAAIIAECTTSSGPSDDHFIVVIDLEGQEHVFRAKDFPAAIEPNIHASTCGFETKLHGTTTNDSRIIFPPTLAEHKLYKYTYYPPKSLTLRLLQVQMVQSEFTDEVKMYLHGLRENKAVDKDHL